MIVICGVLTAFFGFLWLGATFWLLSRSEALEHSSSESRFKRKWQVAGDVEVHLPTFIGQLRRREWSPTTLPFLVTAIFAFGFMYSMFLLFLLLALRDKNPIVAGLVALALLYATMRLVNAVWKSIRMSDSTPGSEIQRGESSSPQ